ncbi:MAG: exodeoxyribonuclease VII large subunit, partial [Candidatus Binataceae bacterium]
VSAVGHEIDYSIADFVADVRAPTPTAAGQIVVPDMTDLHQRIESAEVRLSGAILTSLGRHRQRLDQLGSYVKPPAATAHQARLRLDDAAAELDMTIHHRLEDARRRLRELAGRLRTPAAREQRLLVARLASCLGQALAAKAAPRRLALERLRSRLDVNNFRRTLAARRNLLEDRRARLSDTILAAINSRRIQLAAAAGRLDSLSPLRVLERGYAVAVNQRDHRAIVDAATVEIGDELDIRLKRGRLRARTVAREN